jgi:outer membrane protein assembly factor BamA
VLRWLVGVDFQADYIRQYEDSLLSIERPDDEGWTRRGTYLGGASWDSRDNEWSPTWGGLHEVTLALAGPWAGASSIWGRFNATFRWYRPLGTEKLVFAQRLTFDALIGDVPLFELGLFGGLSPTEGYGGREAGRGFFRRRFAAPVKGLSVTELRYQPFEWPIRRRTLGLGFKAFADIGELFRPEAFLADGAHIAGGPGLFIVWDRFFVLRADVGFSSEGVQWYVISSHSF